MLRIWPGACIADCSENATPPEPGETPKAPYALAVSPRPSARKYWRTTLALKRPKSLSASTVVAGAAVADGATDAIGEGAGAFVNATCGVAVATGFIVATGFAIATGFAVASRGDAEYDGSGEAASVIVGRGEGACAMGSGVCVCVGAALAVTDSTARGVASGASVAGANVGDCVGSADGVTSATLPGDAPWRPAIEKPAPITKPSTMTPIRNGMSGNVDSPLRLFCGRRERRGGISSIALRFRSMRFASMRAPIIPVGTRTDIEKMDAKRKRSGRT